MVVRSHLSLSRGERMVEKEEASQDNPDSVTLKRNAKGDLAWDIKCYFPTDTPTDVRVAKVNLIHIQALKMWGK